MQSSLSLKNISYTYKNSKIPVIENFSLEVEKGSFTTLLGASGSGKTTLLRLISGFLTPSSGEILINEKNVNNVLPERRKIGMVFQDYALFPHLTVKQNILYGLKLKNSHAEKNLKESKEALNQKILSAAKSLSLESLLDRYPNELSGGQQQRVALARALVLEPDILLMDEPLSSLDNKLRQSVRAELKDIQQRLKITTIYVTHDQEEALSLSDKIAVLHKGKLLQYGTSRQIYFAPEDSYTAEFIGSANFVNIDGKKYMVRPEWVKFSTKQPDEKNNYIEGKIISSEFSGAKVRYKIQSGDNIIFADTPSYLLDNIKEGTNVFLTFEFQKEF